MNDSTDIVERLKELADARERATLGPWQVVVTEHPYNGPLRTESHKERRIFTSWNHGQLKAPLGVVNSSRGVGENPGDPWRHMVSISEPDAVFIVAAANFNYADALAEIRRLRAEKRLDPHEVAQEIVMQVDEWLCEPATTVTELRERIMGCLTAALRPDGGEAK